MRTANRAIGRTTTWPSSERWTVTAEVDAPTVVTRRSESAREAADIAPRLAGSINVFDGTCDARVKPSALLTSAPITPGIRSTRWSSTCCIEVVIAAVTSVSSARAADALR